MIRMIRESTENHTKRMREYNRKLRIKAYQKLGEFCWACGSKTRLSLHHDYYSHDSAKGSSVGSKRYLEAIRHPERFMVLCKSCHSRHHIFERYENNIKQEFTPILHKFLLNTVENR